MVTLANNYTYDFGDSGIAKSLLAIKSNGLDRVGAGRDLEEASVTFYKVLKRKYLL